MESCKKLHLKIKACVKGREITAKLKDTLQESMLRKNTDTEMYHGEKADSKNRVDHSKTKKSTKQKEVRRRLNGWLFWHLV